MVMRITGMGSGMDIPGMIDQLMRAERAPLDKLNQKKQLLNWKVDRYREINLKLSSFRDALSNLRFSSPWTVNKASGSTGSGPVTVSADASASAISHTIEVAKLAAGAKTASSGAISTVGAMTGANDASTAAIDSTNNQINVTLNGVTKAVTIDSNASGYSTAGLQAALQKGIDQAFGANQITVGSSGSKLTMQTNGATGSLPQLIVGAVTGNGGLAALGFTAGQSNKVNPASTLDAVSAQMAGSLTATATGSFTINGQSISYNTSTDSLNSIISKVNTSAAGVNMSYDPVADKVSVTTKTTGSTAQIDIKDVSGTLMSALKITTATPVKGQDADVTIDGVQSFRSTNSFTVSGVTYTLNAETTAPVTTSITRDTDAIFNKIKDFVSKYNDVVDLMNTRRNEQKYRDFAPLTDEQKAGMKDSEITLWQEKAESGVLSNDTIIGSTLSKLRLLTSEKVQGLSGSFDTLYKIGVTTQPYNRSAPNDSGKLQVDETKLKNAIAQDPDGVIALFSQQNVAPGATLDQKGVAQGMYELVNTAISSISGVAGRGTGVDVTSSLGLQIGTLQQRITTFNSKLSAKENNYYIMFGKMDSAIQESNNKLSWIQKQIG